MLARALGYVFGRGGLLAAAAVVLTVIVIAGAGGAALALYRIFPRVWITHDTAQQIKSRLERSYYPLRWVYGPVREVFGKKDYWLIIRITVESVLPLEQCWHVYMSPATGGGAPSLYLFGQIVWPEVVKYCVSKNGSLATFDYPTLKEKGIELFGSAPAARSVKGRGK